MALARRRPQSQMAKMREQLKKRNLDLKFYRQKAKDVQPHFMDSVQTVAGAAVAGFVQTNDFAIPSTIAGIKTEAIVGSVLLGYGLMQADKIGDKTGGMLPKLMINLGTGMLCTYTADKIFTTFNE